jgi:DNA-damage-inducible protein J
MKDTYVRARISPELKEESEVILESLGLSTAEAIRLFLAQVKINKGLPFKISLIPDNDDLLASPQMRQQTLDSFYDD